MRVYIAGAMTGVFKYKEKFTEAEELYKRAGAYRSKSLIFTRGALRLLRDQ